MEHESSGHRVYDRRLRADHHFECLAHPDMALSSKGVLQVKKLNAEEKDDCREAWLHAVVDKVLDFPHADD